MRQDLEDFYGGIKAKKKKKGKPCSKNKMEGLTLQDTNVNTYSIKTVQNRQRDRQPDNDTV